VFDIVRQIKLRFRSSNGPLLVNRMSALSKVFNNLPLLVASGSLRKFIPARF
jgi:hypothetical protein